jgi:uncharacterized protein with gpF-like domain
MKRSNSIKWKALENSRKPYYRFAERQFFEALMMQLKPLIDRAGESVLSAEQVSQLLSEEPMRDKFKYVYKEVGPEFAEKMNNQFTGNGNRRAFEAFFSNYVDRYAGEKITSITNVSADYARRIINSVVREAGGLGEGETARAIQKELRTSGAKISNWRARVIARTEVATASNVGQHVGAEAVGQPMMKRWLPTMDGRTRDAHGDMASADPVRLNEPFNVNGELLMTPCDPNGSPENVINCRCGVTYEVII